MSSATSSTQQGSGLRTAAQQAANAGYAGSIDASNQLGVSANALGRIGRIYARQFELFFEDQRKSMEMFGRTMDPLSTLMDHLGRRTEHVSAGLREVFETVQETAERSASLGHSVWDPLAAGSNMAMPATSPRNVLDRLHTDHERFEDVLARLEEIGNKPDPLLPEDEDVLVQGVRYISEYPDAVHHPLEDRLFQHLLAADLTEDERRDVQNNAAAHLQLSNATARIFEDVKALQAGNEPAGKQLREDLHSYIEVQRRHMAFEGEKIFPLAERKLPARAQREISDADARSRDPLFDQRLERFNGLYDYVSGRS